MKTLPWKKLAVAVVAVALGIAGIFYFTASPGKKNPTIFVNPAFAEYINSYTTGVIPSGSALSIVFSNDMVDSTMAGQESSEKLFDFTPSLPGKTVWLDNRTVEFRPDSRMTSGKVYTAKFFLSRLTNDLPEELRTFEYSFQVVPQNFEVMIVNIKSYSKTELKRGVIEGNFNTADYSEGPEVEKAIKAIQEGKTLNLTWTHTEDGKQHSFIVEEVIRKEEAGKVNIRVDGSVIGIDRVHEMQVDIPPLDDFKLMTVRVVQTPTQHVVLQFSDPVKEDQNLNGLIRISDLPSLDFDIHNNEIWVYPPVHQNGSRTISVTSGIRNVLDMKLKNPAAEEVFFEQLKPAVRFTGKGSILPSTNGLVVPFEAVNLNAVDIQILKIFENNALQFFQVNNLEGKNELRRVGKTILRKKTPLENTGITDLGKWNRYTLDISRLIQAEPGAIYEVKLGFKKAYSTYACETSDPQPETSSQFESEEDYPEENFDGSYYYDYYDDYYYGEDFDWQQRDNPCNSSYYTPNRAVTKNILASDLGLTVKRGEDGNTLVFVTDLKTAKPIAGVEVTLYSYQLQSVGTASTDADGKISILSKNPPFALVARNGSQRGYLRLINGEALLVSSFDVSGEVIQKGLKGFLYGERGVWRPGDSLFLTFVLEDKRKLLPSNHPVVFELSNPQGQVMNRIVRASSENGFYNFATATGADAPTGNWLARVKVGGTEFTETLKIETVKPNRLKINLEFGTDKFTSANVNGKLEVKWLHGAPGRNLKAEFDVILMRLTTGFKQFPDFNFDDPSREFVSESQPFFTGNTDSEGTAAVVATLEGSGAPSGFLNAVFRGKVFEESGNFSIERFSIPYSPYSSYVGMRIPEGERYSGILYTDTNQKIAIATSDTEGQGISRNGIEINLYKLNWRWWWDNTNESLANFVESSYAKLVKSEAVNTTKGKGEWTFNLPAAEYGRYFLRTFEVLKEISSALGDNGYWMSTQETAMCLRSVGAFAGRQKRGELKFTYKIGNGKSISASTGLPIAQIQIPVNGLREHIIEVENQSEGVLFTRLISTGTPARGDEQDESHHLNLNVKYTDTRGNPIDPSQLEQGSEFVAEVAVSHPGIRSHYENLALSQVFPSGWEINNLRLQEAEQFLKTSSFRYQDIRDDRVFTYFNLAPREEKTFRVLITAAYAGTYYLPATTCEAMYDRSIYARKKGQSVAVQQPATR